MYQHRPTGEYRLFLHWDQNPASGGRDSSYVFALGSGQPPSHIECLEVSFQFHSASLLFRGNLHWHVWESGINFILVFNTIAESFCKMPSPVGDGVRLFEMDDMLGVYTFSHAAATIDIWVLQDYESAVWAFKCRVELPVAEIRLQFENFSCYSNVVVTTSSNGDVLVLVGFAGSLLQFDVSGKLVASFHRKGMVATQFCLKQTLVPHTFLPTLG
jgi:hypothetical protein